MPTNGCDSEENSNEVALNSSNAELLRLQSQYDALSKSKDLIVMLYANSEKEVFKLKGELDNSQKQFKNIMKENESLNQKNKQLTADRSHFSHLAESKSSTSEEENKKLRQKVTDLQNELKGIEITKSQFSKDFAKQKTELQDKLDESNKKINELQEQLQKAHNDFLEAQRTQKESEEQDIEKIQKEVEKLKQDLASKEFVINWTQDRVLALECECEQVRHNNAELLNDMSTCRAREAELVAYTQAVTEKNVSLQSKLSSVEAKVSALEEENSRVVQQIKEVDGNVSGVEKAFLIEKNELKQDKENLLKQIFEQQEQTTKLQQQLDEARGETLVLRKRHEASLKELNKELRRHIKDTSSDGMSQSSRTSSCSSLNTLEANAAIKRVADNANCDNKQELVPDNSALPVPEVLVDRIVKLQKLLAKKQDKIDFLEDNTGQLIEALQQKSKIIQAYGISQDPGALSTETSDKNKAEVIKHGGIMASIFSSKPTEELTLELILEINSKLQAVLEDLMLKNITLKDSMQTLGLEVSKLTEENKQLVLKLEQQGI